MTTIETHAKAAQGSAVESFVGGVAAWSVTTDHKRIGRIYLGFGLLGLLAVSVLGVLLGIERASTSDVFE
jgi:cytochrome o ubiquinol oxidase subunit 1